MNARTLFMGTRTAIISSLMGPVLSVVGMVHVLSTLRF
ncbi:hypothetical protein PsAD14_00054 [Pseudovibrio sp. Ad14]|nr:hypothetical protein PsW74_02411 [Pseudovibrio sp. W74]KZL11892.1 hypothetical protein PsAD14_00054 [Pseudovibrio sp. Ad14]